MWNIKLSWGQVGNQLRTSEDTMPPSSAGPTALLHYCLWEDSSPRPGLLAAGWSLHCVCVVTCCPLPEGTVPGWVRSVSRDSFRAGSFPPSVIYSQNKAFLVTLGCAVFSSEDIVRMVVINKDSPVLATVNKYPWYGWIWPTPRDQCCQFMQSTTK